MKGNAWEYDNVYFIGQIRRSGGSLILTIPNELRNRFLINEGQKVRIIGVTRRRAQVEGGLLIFLGRFSVIEEVDGYTLRIEVPRDIDVEEAKRELYSFLSKQLNATHIRFKDEDTELLVEAHFGCIVDNDIVPREDDIDIIGEKITRYLGKKGYKILAMKKIKEIQRWNNIDPSIIKRYSTTIPESISFEWKLT